MAAQHKIQKIRIGDLLLQKGLITADQLNYALAHQSGQEKIGQILINMGAIDEQTILETTASQLGIPYTDLQQYPIKPDVSHLIPEVQARRYRAIAIDRKGKDILVGMSDPTDVLACDEIRLLLKQTLQITLVSEHALLQVFDNIYRHSSATAALTQQINDLKRATPMPEQAQPKTDELTPVNKLLTDILEDAVKAQASDIHLEPHDEELRIRFRVDGILVIKNVIPAQLVPALISRLKLMSELDISEKRLPQDGRFKIHILNQQLDVRLSTMPLLHHETVVMRLLYQSKAILGLDKLGMPARIRDSFSRIIHQPHGMILAVGPTGCGKTTTLYAALNELHTPNVKIITAEDPVEYHLPGIMQVQIKPKIDLTFARVLRSMLRQDPDILLIGEMRDQETMEIALRAAMTGHTVLSTLHTNDAVSTMLRLIDMGAESYLIAATLRCILSQRLLRKICSHCAAPDQPSAPHLELIKKIAGGLPKQALFRKGQGCSQCDNTGYHGRMPVYELLEIDPTISQALHNRNIAELNQLATRQPGYRSIQWRAMELAIKGITTMDEAERVCFGMED
ncbi:MAG: Flp pilus assembly complex ATPase component TadA [Gammaproteobacteria bacterium]|nr:Flp pilus assembly complex ATPase component TadA [Gammaproteobacteria bacterium]